MKQLCALGWEMLGEQGSVQQQAVAESRWLVRAIRKTDYFLPAPVLTLLPITALPVTAFVFIFTRRVVTGPSSSAKSRWVERVAVAPCSCWAVLSHGVQQCDRDGHTIQLVS